MELTEEQRAQVRVRQVANIIAKLNQGKTISAREQAILETDADPEKAANYARTWAELAQRLGVSRIALQQWRQDPRYEKHCPPNRTDGRKDVSAWSVFMLRFGLKRSDETVTPAQIPEELRTIRDFKEYREKLMCEKLEREILRDDGKLLVAIDLEIALGQLVAGVSLALDHFAPSAARFVVGLRDIHDVQAKLQSEIDAIKQKINAARYLDDCIGEIAQSFPFNKETEELYRRVSFSGQDRDLFVALLRSSTIEALRRLGRLTLANGESNHIQPASPESQSPEPSGSNEAAPKDRTPIVAAKKSKSSRKRRAVTSCGKRAGDQASGTK